MDQIQVCRFGCYKVDDCGGYAQKPVEDTTIRLANPIGEYKKYE